MVQSAFHFHLNEKIQRAQAAIGKLDGQHPSLVCATTAGKVFVHSPHGSSSSGLGGAQDATITYLNINKQITALAVGCLAPRGGRDVLLIGTPGTLHCYDVHDNKDVFFKDLSDGANAIVVGVVSGAGDKPLAIGGGNCSVQGFDQSGAEKLWTVTGGNVTAMTLCDVDGDGQRELVVGSDDLDLRAFSASRQLAEASEADAFVSLTAVHAAAFGYGLANGTVGVYDRLDRIWRVKSKYSVCALSAHDLDGDGVPELISGWNNGRVEVRRQDTGELTFRDHLGSAISAILAADYRGDGRDTQAVVCAYEGEVRGYMASDPSRPALDPDCSVQQAALAALAARKQQLAHELASYQNSADAKAKADVSNNLLPPGTTVDVSWSVDVASRTMALVARTSTARAGVTALVVFGEHVFEEESLLVVPKAPSQQLVVPLTTAKDVGVVLLVKTLVAMPGATAHHVFETDLHLPPFAMYVPVPLGSHPTPASHALFTVPDRLPRLLAYLESRFRFRPSPGSDPSASLTVLLLCLRDGAPLHIQLLPTGNAVQVTLSTDNVDAAGEVVADMVGFLGLTELHATAHFPPVAQLCEALLTRVKERNASRLQMAADAADGSGLVKALLVRAEDARILGDLPAMRRHYKRLHDVNRDLIADHDRRIANHAALLADLKEVNTAIQRMAKLRAGQAKTRLVAACRAAVKQDNTALLLRVMRDGADVA